ALRRRGAGLLDDAPRRKLGQLESQLGFAQRLAGHVGNLDRGRRFDHGDADRVAAMHARSFERMLLRNLAGLKSWIFFFLVEHQQHAASVERAARVLGAQADEGRHLDGLRAALERLQSEIDTSGYAGRYDGGDDDFTRRHAPTVSPRRERGKYG